MSKHKSKHSKHREMIQEADALRVVCPRCGAWTKKSCMHTTGSKVGQPTSPHPDRIKMAKAILNLSPDTKKKLKHVDEADTEIETKPKSPKEKLTPEQKVVVETVLDKIYGLQRQAEFVGPVTKGPLLSIYRFRPMGRTRVLHIEGMHKDFAVELATDEDILVKRMPGEVAVGIFVPNKDRQMIRLQDTLPNVMAYMQKPSKDGHRKIPLNFGITVTGEPFLDDLTMQPHLLVAGSTDSGKSTCMNALLQSMALSMNPDELRICMSDTKKVEFKPYYKELPHLARPIAGDIHETMALLEYLKRETDFRLTEFAKGEHTARNIHEFNQLHPDKAMPFIVCFIDELADIMGDQVDRGEAKVNASKLGAIVGRSRAAGIYMIVGVQRPSVNVIKGSIKTNFPSRVAFRLPSTVDSKTVLDMKGAEHLMSRGDMFYKSSQRSDILRLHAPYTTLDDLKEVVKTVIQKEAIRKPKPMTEEEEERLAIQQEGSGKPIEKKPTIM